MGFVDCSRLDCLHHTLKVVRGAYVTKYRVVSMLQPNVTPRRSYLGKGVLCELRMTSLVVDRVNKADWNTVNLA